MFQCRFYEQEWPKEGQIVVVKIKEIHEHGISCSLLEYNGIEGYVPISELTRRRIRSKKQSEMKKGQLDLAKVVTVDEERGFIDLNKEQLPREVVEEVTIRWNNSKKVHSIMKYVAQRIETPVAEVYEKFLWPLARDMCILGNNHAIMGLLFFHENPEGMARKYCLQQKFVEALLPALRGRLKPRQHKITALIKVQCSGRWRDMLMKRALKAAALVSTPSCPVEIVQKEQSVWEVKIHTLKPLEGSVIIWQILDKIRRVLTFGKRGQFWLLKAPVMFDPYKNWIVVKCQDPSIQISESNLLKTSFEMDSKGNDVLSIIDPNKDKSKEEVQSSTENSKKIEVKDRCADQPGQPTFCLLGGAKMESALRSYQSNDLISSRCQKTKQKKNIEFVPLTESASKPDELPQPHSSLESQNYPLKRLKELNSNWQQVKQNRSAPNPQLQEGSFNALVLNGQQKKTSLQRAELSSITSARTKVATNTSGKLNEVNSTIFVSNRDKEDQLMTDSCQNANSQSKELGRSSPHISQLRKPLEGHLLPSTNPEVIPHTLSLSPYHSSPSKQSCNSHEDKFLSPSQEVSVQPTQMLKCNSNHIHNIERCPPSLLVSNSLSPRISPQGLTLLQQKYLRELLSDSKLDDPDVSRQHFTFPEPNDHTCSMELDGPN